MLTILRCGLGRDSLAMLCLLVERKLVVDGATIGPDSVDAVVFSDTGAEWRSTYALIPRVRALCERFGLRFIAQMKPTRETVRRFYETRTIGQKGGQPWRERDPGTIEKRAALGWYHLRGDIMADYGSKGTIVAMSDPSCTANHKIGPNRMLLDDLSTERFGVGNRAWSAAVKRGEREPHRMLLGIAADESHRAVEGPGPLYERDMYPLVEMGVSKSDESAILARHGLDDAHKSGCVMCKFQPLGWYWALSVVEPDTFAEVVAYEARAVERNPKLLVFPRGGLALPEAVAKWRAENPEATVEAVMRKDYKRGGCKAEPEKAWSGEATQLGLFAA